MSINWQILMIFSCWPGSILTDQKFNNKFKEILWIGIYIDGWFLVFKGNKRLSIIKIGELIT